MVNAPASYHSDLSELLGDDAEAAAEELRRTVGSLLNRLAGRYVIVRTHRDDLLQEVLTICLRQAHKIGRGQAEPLENRDAWLSRVTLHTVLGLGRKLTRRQGEKSWPEGFDPPAPAMLSPEVRHTVRTALAGLDRQCRKLLLLRDVLQEGRQAIAETLGITTNALGVRLHRCRKKLLEMVQAGEAELR